MKKPSCSRPGSRTRYSVGYASELRALPTGANSKPIPIPFGPLAEHHRIVTKVDAVMALCDRLEASLTTTAATRRLMEALVP